MKAKLGALAVVVIMLAPQYPPQCDQQVFRRSNPAMCTDTPFPTFPPLGGGPRDGGGLIGRILGGLTGGLL